MYRNFKNVVIVTFDQLNISMLNNKVPWLL